MLISVFLLNSLALNSSVIEELKTAYVKPIFKEFVFLIDTVHAQTNALL